MVSKSSCDKRDGGRERGREGGREEEGEGVVGRREGEGRKERHQAWIGR
jgi:hypothetical protein